MDYQKNRRIRILSLVHKIKSMKYTICLLGLLSFSFLMQAQNVGIGTTSPLARLHVADSNVIFSSSVVPFTTSSQVPVSGAGSRFMWLPASGTFRVGVVNNSSWDNDSIGLYSTAFGFNTKAMDIGSVAIGYSTTARGSFSTAMGQFSTASGSRSTAMGFSTNAGGAFSTAMGYGTDANAYSSIAIGRYNDGIATSSKESWVSTDPLFYIGNGSANLSRSNALLIYKNGNTDINGFTRLGESNSGAPRIKTKKITGYNTPGSASPNSFTFVPHGIADASKILSVNVLVNVPGGFDFLPHSTETGYIYTVNTDPTGGGAGPNIAVGVKSLAQSNGVMGRPIRIFITYEE
jgi:hypothetical protein